MTQVHETSTYMQLLAHAKRYCPVAELNGKCWCMYAGCWSWELTWLTVPADGTVFVTRESWRALVRCLHVM